MPAKEIFVTDEIISIIGKIPDKPVDPTVFVTSNGVKMRLRRVSDMVIAETGRQIRIPKPPVLFNDEKQRNEENPNDPDYLQDYEDAQYRRSMLIYAAYITLGTADVTLPENVDDLYPLESNEWVDPLRELNLDIPESGRGRYIAWMKYHILNNEDMSNLARSIMRLSGKVFEDEVEKAADNFPDNTSRQTNNGVSSITEDTLRNSVS